MCKMVEIKVGDKCIKVAEIKKTYIENIIKNIHRCKEIDKIVLFGSSLDESCTNISDVDIAIFGKISKDKMFRLKSYNDFIDSIVSYGDLQDYDMLYFDTTKEYSDQILEDIGEGEVIFEREMS